MRKRSLKRRIALILAFMMFVMNCVPAFGDEIIEDDVIYSDNSGDQEVVIEGSGEDDVSDPEEYTEENTAITDEDIKGKSASVDRSEEIEDADIVDGKKNNNVLQSNLSLTSQSVRTGSLLLSSYYDENGSEWHELDGVVWSISDNNKTLTISPNEEKYGNSNYGKINDSGDPDWKDYKGTITKIQLKESKLHPGEGIKAIGRFAFRDFENLSSIRISETVEEIGYGAFINCKMLESLQIDNSYYFENSEKGCLYKKLTPGDDNSALELLFAPAAGSGTLVIDPRTVKIGGYACYNADKYTGVVYIPASVGSIGEFAFFGCKKINEVVIGKRAYGNNIGNCNSQLSTIGQECFSGCSKLSTMWLPTSLETKFGIDENPLRDCGYLSRIYVYAVSVSHDAVDKVEALNLNERGKADLGIQKVRVVPIPWNYCIIDFYSTTSTKETLIPVCVSYNQTLRDNAVELYHPTNESTVADFRFLWWYKGENENARFTEDTKVTSDVTVNAKWCAYFKVTFDAGEGRFKTKDASSINTQFAYRSLSGGSILAENEWPEDPVKDNAKFVGWMIGERSHIILKEKPDPYASAFDEDDQSERSDYEFPSNNLKLTAFYYDYKTVSFCGPNGEELGAGWLDLEINEYLTDAQTEHLENLHNDYWNEKYAPDTNWEFVGWYPRMNGNGIKFNPYSPVPNDVYGKYYMYFKHYLKMRYYLGYDKDGDGEDDVISINGKDYDIYANKEYTLMNPPERPGYKFDGWWSADGNTRYDSTLRYYEVTGDFDFYAHWKKLCKVTLHRNYEKIYTPDYLRKKENKDLLEPHVVSDVVEGSDIMYDYMIPNDTVSNNWKFDGWYIDGEFDDESKKVEKNTPVTDDIEVYAKWVEGCCTVVYWATTKIVVDEKYVKNEVWGKNVEPGTKLPIFPADHYPSPEECEYYGYRFGGWTDDKGELVIDENGKLLDPSLSTVEKDLDFYSYWIDNGGPYAPQVQVTFNTMGGPEIPQPGTIDINTPIAKPDDPVWENHKFMGWFTSPDYKIEWDFSKDVDQDMILYAKWIDWTEEDEDNAHGIYWVRMIRKSKASLAEYFKESGLTYSYDRSLVSVSKKSMTVKSKMNYGETLITATKVDGSEYPVAVRVFVLEQKLEDMYAYNTSMSMNAADYLTVSGFLPDRWESSKPKVASIDQKTGVITIRSRGTCKIKAYYKNKAVIGTLHSDVPKFARSFYRMKTGQTKRIKIKKIKKYDIVSWNVISGDGINGSTVSAGGTGVSQNRSSSYNSAELVGTAEIDNNGRLTALTAGDVIVQATVYGQTITTKVHIEPPILRKKAITMNINKTKRLKLSRTKLKNVDWESTNDQVAYVDPVSGKVYGLKTGRVTLRTYAGGVYNSCVVQVKDPSLVSKGPGLSK